MYKKLITIVCLVVFATCAFAQYSHRGRRPAYALGAGGSQYAQRKPDKKGLLTGAYSGRHYLFGAYVDGAYSGLPSTLPQAQFTPGGYSTAAGLVFEYNRNYFSVQVGAAIEWQDVTNTIADTIFQYQNVYDRWTYPFILQYDFHKRQDEMRQLYMQVPLLIGGRFAQWYLLCGAKLKVPLPVGSTRMKVIGTTTGIYEQFLGIYEEMDNHGLRKDVPFSRDGEKLGLPIDISLSAEIGYEWGKYAKGETGFNSPKFELDTRYRVALFADVGLLNINPHGGNEYLIIPMDDYRYDFPRYQMNHIFSSNLTSNRTIHNFNVGLKLTVLVGFMAKSECRICGPWGFEGDF